MVPNSCKSLITMIHQLSISPADQVGIRCGVLRVRIIAFGIAHGPSCERIINLWSHDSLTLYAMYVLNRQETDKAIRPNST